MQTVADRNLSTSFAGKIGAGVDAVRGFGRSILMAHWATQELARFNAMSDQELANHGITRDEIVRTVAKRYLLK